ncbi:MAG TPA: CBS domain-containing protein [Burkholderiaceae bacterium]|nr:CBS domain-containing protein [Burkholderiaceae bacterium]
MIVRNWMQPDPILISSDMLVSEAKRILSENRLHALPVVDDGKLRGLVTRANLLRVGHFVMRTQNPDEFNFFATRLRVRDIMLRNPATVRASDTMEHCLSVGRELGVAQLPVMEGEQVVGIISANEIFQLASHLLGAWERRSGVTLAPLTLGPGVLGGIVDVVEAAGAVVQAVYPVGRDARQGQSEYPQKKVILRLHAADSGQVVAALERAGFTILECTNTQPAALVA